MMGNESRPIGRRDFLSALGAGVASGAMLAQPRDARAQDKAAQPLRVVDFHNHYVGPSFTLTTMNNTPPALRENQAQVNALLSDPRALLGSLDVAGVAARVINTPTAFLQDADGNVPKGTIPGSTMKSPTLQQKTPARSMASRRSMLIAGTMAPVN